MPCTSESPQDKPWLPTGEIEMTSLHLPLIVKSAKVHPCIRGLALHLLHSASPYCNIGFFFKSLPDDDLLYLLDQFKLSEYENLYPSDDSTFPALQEITLLAFLLGRAEGETDTNPEFLKEAVPALGTLIMIEHYSRQRNACVNRMNYSLTTCDRIIVDSKTALEMQEYFRDFD